MMAKYYVRFYVSLSGKAIVRDNLDNLSIHTRAKVLRTLEIIRHYGLSSSIPQLRKITSTPLWELRVLGKDNIRIVCCRRDFNTITVLHIFVKKSKKTPTKDLQLSLKRYKNC